MWKMWAKRKNVGKTQKNGWGLAKT